MFLILFASIDPAVSVTDNQIVNAYQLNQNYPNPFNPSTRINYKVGEPGLVQLKVYNVLGVEVASLVNEHKSTENILLILMHQTFQAESTFTHLRSITLKQTRKMILEK